MHFSSMSLSSFSILSYSEGIVQRIKFINRNLYNSSNYRVPPHFHLRAEYILRISLVLLTFSLAAAIPKLDLFISLVGAVSR